MIETIKNSPLTPTLLHNYFRTLVDRFFKIIPIWEEELETLPSYMDSLQLELLGLREFVVIMKDDQRLLSLLSILQYLIDNPECSKVKLKREVFHAISVCNKLDVDYFRILSGDIANSKAGGVKDESMELL